MLLSLKTQLLGKRGKYAVENKKGSSPFLKLVTVISMHT